LTIYFLSELITQNEKNLSFMLETYSKENKNLHKYAKAGSNKQVL